MGGGLLQLVAYGAQDIYLTGNPQITFFKNVSQRHTNFALEPVTIPITSCFGQSSKVVIARNGDLVSNMYLHINLEKLAAKDTSVDAEDFCNGNGWVNAIGHAIIDSIQLQIGGQCIDTQSGEFMEVYTQLSQTNEKDQLFESLIGREFNASSKALTSSVSNRDYNLYIPLNFWFNKCYGLSLPLIALQYHEVSLYINWRKFSECWTSTESGIDNVVDQRNICAELLVDYIYLDTDERKRFAQNSHEYLISQTQEIKCLFDANSTLITQSLNYNHPVKEVIWTIKYKDMVNNHYNIEVAEAGHSFSSCGVCCASDYTVSKTSFRNNHFNFGIPDVSSISNTLATFKHAHIRFNGTARIAPLDAKYFNSVQPYQHHTRCPGDGIYVYSFALFPEDKNPSGSANWSRLDNATLNITLNNINSIISKSSDPEHVFTNSIELTVYAININVLRILSGMAGLAYSN